MKGLITLTLQGDEDEDEYETMTVTEAGDVGDGAIEQVGEVLCLKFFWGGWGGAGGGEYASVYFVIKPTALSGQGPIL
jgi:hypothetical protein